MFRKGNASLLGKPCQHKWRRKHRAWMIIKFHFVCFYKDRRLGANLWSDRIHMLVLGQNWKICHKRLARLIMFISQTEHYRQYSFVGDKIQDCKLGLFQEASIA